MPEPLTAALDDLPGPDGEAAETVRDRTASALRPAGALERLDELAAWLAAWQRRPRPVVDSPVAVVFVADHGVAVEGVSAYPRTVTSAMLRALREGAATASVMAAEAGVRLSVVDVGVGHPTENLRREPALSEDRFARCVAAGRRAVAEATGDLVVVGEMGIGNTTSAAAVCASLFGRAAEDWTGRGTGVGEDGYRRKVAVVEEARRRVEGAPPLEILRQVGGAELAAIAGAVVEARVRSVPVLLDGFVVTAAVAPLEVVRPGALEHCLPGHVSAEPGHELLLEKLGMEPLLDLGLRLGEASGALLAVPLLRLAAAAATGVGTFEEWGLER